ncbi:hypothetical protein RvY_07522-2 [Ramazzottius varieornatus]|uniref:RNA polymerase II-associated protein 3 n=1 Tax=Ramazzottius varieornatus TaxID=947166 RepID=A0A1D1V2H1_RAMVA|nr:hypothetical protein RvY_07522-2 [Ramazzottius varieornatus]
MGDEEDKVRNKLRELQCQIRQNANQTTDYLSDLQEWTSDMRQKDAGLLQKSTSGTVTKAPIRRAPIVEVIDPAGSTRKTSGRCIHQQRDADKKEKIKSYDYRAWDKFNVDEACDDVDYQTAKVEDEEHCGSECEYEENDISNEELELAAKKKRAELEKIKGNEFFEKGKYLEASMAYTRALGFDYKNPVYFSNRAMACLKLKKFAEAEKDSSSALALDPSYLKAYHRRATARLSLKNIAGAKSDFLMVLKLDPANGDAKEKLEIIRQWEERLGLKTSSSVEGKPQSEAVPVGKSTSVKAKMENELEKEAIINRRGMVEVKTVKVEQKSSETSADTKNRIPLEFLPTPAVPSSTKSLKKIEIRDAADVVSSEASKSQSTVSTRPSAPTSVAPDFTGAANLPEELLKTRLSVHKNVPESPSKAEPVALPSKQLVLSWKDFSQKCFSLHNNPPACADFIQQIPPSSYAKLIGQTLEPEMFSAIVNGSVELCQRGLREDALSHLAALANVPRFGFFVHLLTEQQKQGLRQCLDNSRDSGGEDNTDERISTAAKKFSLNLEV